MNKRMLYFLFLVVFLLSFTDEKKDSTRFISFGQNEECRIFKIFRNSELIREYHYDKMNRLVKAGHYLGNAYNFSIAEYDELGRLRTTNKYFTRRGVVLKPDSSNYIQSQFRSEFYYKSKTNLIDEVISYSGYSTSSNDGVEEEEVKYFQQAEYIYNSDDVLIEILVRYKKKKKKSTKIIIKYDERKNPILFQYYENKKNGKLLRSIEREYDKSASVFFNFGISDNYVLSTNNLIYEKVTIYSSVNHLGKHRVQEEKMDYEYNDDGLITGFSYLDRDSMMTFIEYEYLCD